MAEVLWKGDWQVLIKVNIHLPYDPRTSLLGIYPKGMKTYVHTKLCMEIFIAALFTAIKNCTQSRCSSTGEWINKLCYVSVKEYHSTINKNELKIRGTTCMNCKCVMLS